MRRDHRHAMCRVQAARYPERPCQPIKSMATPSPASRDRQTALLRARSAKGQILRQHILTKDSADAALSRVQTLTAKNNMAWVNHYQAGTSHRPAAPIRFQRATEQPRPLASLSPLFPQTIRVVTACARRAAFARGDRLARGLG